MKTEIFIINLVGKQDKKMKDNFKSHEEIEDFKKEQLRLAQEILQETDINIVTCGDCGSVMLHKVNVEELECGYCGLKDDISSFPDLYY